MRKSRGILRGAYGWYKRNWKKLSPEKVGVIEGYLERLDQAVLKGDRADADVWARRVEEFSHVHFAKSPLVYVVELLVALLVAFAIAIVVRQMWFEPYEIPTGSMRPTFREKDRLLVTKTSFSLNVPLKTEHFYFDPDLIGRTGVVIWSGDRVDLPDTQAYYFDILPYTKRFIKRLLGKPGDSVYFYGGELWGVDKDGKEIAELREAPWMRGLEYVPFLSFEGRTSVSGPIGQNILRRVVFKHMNLPIARLSIMADGSMSEEIFDGKDWISAAAPGTTNNKRDRFGSFLGIGNYAMARLLTKEQLAQAGVDPKTMEEGVLYLQLSHNPNLSNPAPRFARYTDGRLVPLLTPFETVIPLQQKHIDAIMDNMYTARFDIVDGVARRYSVNHDYGNDLVRYPGIPNGTYELYFGKATKIGWSGWSTSVASDSPLYARTPENIQRLYNLGIEWRGLYAPYAIEQNIYPSRFAYFRNGDLYLLGVPVFKKDDPILQAFNKREKDRENNSTAAKPYVAFKDRGPPMKDGKLDVDFIRTFGVTIPDRHYLVLGDNHAMSQDSRYFGFIPEQNLEGSPSIILWPMQDRFGPPPQKPYQWITLPSIIMWSIALVVALIWYGFHRRRISRPVYRKVSNN